MKVGCDLVENYPMEALLILTITEKVHKTYYKIIFKNGRCLWPISGFWPDDLPYLPCLQIPFENIPHKYRKKIKFKPTSTGCGFMAWAAESIWDLSWNATNPNSQYFGLLMGKGPLSNGQSPFQKNYTLCIILKRLLLWVQNNLFNKGVRI